MQIFKNSFKKQLSFSLMLFAAVSIFINFLLFLSVDNIYRKKISAEIGSITGILSQSIDNFFRVPDDYLKGIREQIETASGKASEDGPPPVIPDIVEFTGTFENVFLLDAEGRVISSRPYDPNFLGIDMSNHDFYNTAPQSGKVLWSETFISTKTGAPTVALTVMSGSGMIAAYYNLNQLENFISMDLPDPDDFIAVLDMKGNIIAHTDRSNVILTGNLSNMTSIQSAVQGEFGIFTDYYDGTKGLVSVEQTDESGFIVMVFKAYDRIFRQLYRVYTLFPLVLLLISILFVSLNLIFIKNFIRPMDLFQNTVMQVAAGDYTVMPTSGFTEFRILSESFRSMVEKIEEREQELTGAISERETLLRELNHRTKNNMQLIIGIMRLYDIQHPGCDPQGIMSRIQSKIETISIVHEKLYKSDDLSHINFREYLEQLIPSLVGSLSAPTTEIDYDLRIDDIYLLLDYAVPCGLVLNELILNSLKYAFDSENGTIEIETVRQDGLLTIRYRDDGTGLPEGFSLENSDSLGFSIINNIIKGQLYGDIELTPGPGFSCEFSFRLDVYAERI